MGEIAGRPGRVLNELAIAGKLYNLENGNSGIVAVSQGLHEGEKAKRL